MTYPVEDVFAKEARLNTLSVVYGNRPEDFAALEIAPSVKVDQPAGEYDKFDRSHQLIVNNALRGPGAEPARVAFGKTEGTYKAHNYALAGEVDWETRRFKSGGVVDPDAAVTSGLHEMRLIETEARFVAEIDATSDHHASNSTTLSGTSQWSDHNNSTPKRDVAEGRLAVHRQIQRLPNVGVTTFEVMTELLHHPDIIEIVKHVGIGRSTEQILADFFGLDRLIIAKAAYNSAARGQTASMAYLWGKDFFLFWMEPAALNCLGIGYHFSRAHPLSEDGQPMVEVIPHKRHKYEIVLHYSGTFNPVTLPAGGSYMIENAIA